MNDELTLDKFLEGYLFMELSNQQVADVAAWTNTTPLGVDQIVGIAESIHDPIVRLKDEFESFESLWQQIVAPKSVVLIDREFDGRKMRWTLLVNPNGFVEQVQGSDGLVWLFCSTLQLLGRTMLNAGLLREARNETGVLDPISEARQWSVVISILADLAHPDDWTELRVSFDGRCWRDDGLEAERLTVIDHLVTVLSAVFDGPIDSRP